MKKFINNYKKKFIRWWAEPASKTERARTAMLCAWSGIWFGLIACFVINSPANPNQIIMFVIGGSVLTAILGLFFPKIMRCIAFPFAFIGIGGGS